MRVHDSSATEGSLHCYISHSAVRWPRPQPGTTPLPYSPGQRSPLCPSKTAASPCTLCAGIRCHQPRELSAAPRPQTDPLTPMTAGLQRAPCATTGAMQEQGGLPLARGSSSAATSSQSWPRVSALLTEPLLYPKPFLVFQNERDVGDREGVRIIGFRIDGSMQCSV